MKTAAIAICIFCVMPPAPAGAARLKDLVSVEGVRDNQLIGYGVVVGLAGTGDRQQTIFSYQTLANILERMGIAVSPSAIRVKNTAAAMVTATLPAFAQPGMTIDTTVAAIGDASNLQGGILVLTSLRGADGQVYAVAQGPVITGGFSAGGGGRGGASQTVNHPTVGRSPNGATVERASPSAAPKSVVRLQLRQSDFTSASRIVAVINRKLGGSAPPARAETPGLVSVAVPAEYAARPIEFLSELENLSVEADRPARVVINERTGTIVLGKDVHIAPVAILHGNLNVEICDQHDGVAAGAALTGRHHPGGAANYRGRTGREGPQRHPERGRHCGGPGACAGGDRLHAARRYCNSAEPAQCGCARGRCRGDISL
jgi:flagellar P-ring protein precursor FlgI